jgi:hypothetical protein
MVARRAVIACLVAVLLAFGIGGGIKAFRQQEARRQRSACLNNIRQLVAPMTCCVPLERRLRDGDPLNPTNVLEYIKGQAMPTCPAGGTYIVTWIVGASNPVCSFHGDLIWETEHVRTLKELDDIRHRRPQSPSEVASSTNRPQN